MSYIIDGKSFSEKLRKKIKIIVDDLKKEFNITPGLAVVLVGEDPASKIYVKNKGKQTIEVGMSSYEYRLKEDISEEKLLEKISELNENPKIHGILCQLPLPKHINSNKVINAIRPEKDVDGFHISNVGLISTGQSAMIPCTPLGCILLLKDLYNDLSGKNAIVIGRSNIVGKPMANLLLKENCTVTIAHSKTKNIEELCKKADIIVAAVGKPNFVKKEWVNQNSTIIDVGINRIDSKEGSSKIVGDVDYEKIKNNVSAITPVPGGVGPMTIACLLSNTITACCNIHELEIPEEIYS